MTWGIEEDAADWMGYNYAMFMDEHGFSADERSKVRFMTSPDLAYVVALPSSPRLLACTLWRAHSVLGRLEMVRMACYGHVDAICCIIRPLVHFLSQLQGKTSPSDRLLSLGHAIGGNCGTY